jgi:excisionase family DNA binding protein
MKTERIASFFKLLDRMLDGIENLVKNHKPTLNGERYLTDREVSARLKVSRRTLQDYRNEGRIPFIQLGGKILYRESDIQRVLDSGYREAFK